MPELTFNNLNQFFEEICSIYRDRQCLGDVSGTVLTYGQVFEKVSELSTQLSSVNIGAGDRVAILAVNSPQWVIAYFAIIRLGGTVVPILTDFRDQDIANVFAEARVKAVFSCENHIQRVRGLRQKDLLVLPINFIFSDNPQEFGALEDPDMVGGIPHGNSAVGDAGAIASIIYTSGTSGHSKGVILNHANFLANLDSASTLMNIQPSWRFLSVLPLSHAYEFSIGLLFPLRHGAAIYYLLNRPTPTVLQRACAIVRPEVVCMVPLLLEKIYKKKVQPLLTDNLLCKGIIKIPWCEKLLLKILGRKVLDFFGGRIKLFAIGGAALNSKVEDFLKKSELPYLLGYGLTEAAPLIAGGPFGDPAIATGSVGKIIPHVEIRLTEVDKAGGICEILVRGPNITRGYLNNKELSRESITPDGWLKTGDLGFMDPQKNLVLTGRVKNVIVLSSGENIYPEEIEDYIYEFLSVSEGLVRENNGKLEVLVVPDYEYIAAKYDLAVQDIAMGGAQVVLDEIDMVRREINSRLPSYAKIHSGQEHPDPLVKTATHKVKRYLY